MHQLLLSALISASNASDQNAIKQPTLQATCQGSKIAYAIGTGNISQRGNLGVPSTSVINIWVFRRGQDGSPTAWLFKRAIDDYYIQFAPTVNAMSFRDLKFYWRYFQSSSSQDEKGPWAPAKVTVEQIFSIENVLGTRGIVRVSCFLGDFKM